MELQDRYRQVLEAQLREMDKYGAALVGGRKRRARKPKKMMDGYGVVGGYVPMFSELDKAYKKVMKPKEMKGKGCYSFIGGYGPVGGVIEPGSHQAELRALKAAASRKMHDYELYKEHKQRPLSDYQMFVQKFAMKHQEFKGPELIRHAAAAWRMQKKRK